MPKNYYIILGIPTDSSERDIKAAYRRLAKEFHPDLYGKKSSPFLTIQEAYSVLSDPASRRSYDSTLLENRKRWEKRRPAESMESQYRESAEPLIPDQGPVDLGNASLSRSFHNYRPSFDALFDRILGNFIDERPKEEMLEKLTIEITLTHQQAFRGGHVRLYVPARLRCPYCNGQGGIGFYECQHCSGAGFFTGEHPVFISYPPGIPDHHAVQISLERYGIRNLYVTVNFRISDMG
ncbi:MAG: DnaJ domain-containing protein [Deltaproteobacteria bacterium]|nr:DnaJ domain-containing protein [Deltaproteobacteria bacterium]